MERQEVAQARAEVHYVGRRNYHRTAGAYHTSAFANKSGLILQMLDALTRQNVVEYTTAKRQRLVHVGLRPTDVTVAIRLWEQLRRRNPEAEFSQSQRFASMSRRHVEEPPT